MSTSGVQTYIYIDVSNIRNACLASCNFNLDFIKLYRYLKTKYPNTQDIRYYEGIAKNDTKKKAHFNFLSTKIGYTICPLERKGYKKDAEYGDFECAVCGSTNKVQILPATTTLKSNVDVYVASDMLTRAAKTAGPVHIVLISCDGDYTEAIYSILNINPDATVTIIATPKTKTNNCLSSRLRVFANRSMKNTSLVNIATFKDRISQPLQPSPRIERPTIAGGPS